MTDQFAALVEAHDKSILRQCIFPKLAAIVKQNAGDQEIGLAWHHVLRDGRRVIWHNGMTGGYSAIVAFSPARRAGIAALANGAGPLPSPLDAPVIDALFGA